MVRPLVGVISVIYPCVCVFSKARHLLCEKKHREIQILRTNSHKHCFVVDILAAI